MWLQFDFVRGPFGPKTGSKSTTNDPDRTSDNLVCSHRRCSHIHRSPTRGRSWPQSFPNFATDRWFCGSWRLPGGYLAVSFPSISVASRIPPRPLEDQGLDGKVLCSSRFGSQEGSKRTPGTTQEAQKEARDGTQKRKKGNLEEVMSTTFRGDLLRLGRLFCSRRGSPPPTR